jgi:hypothetical protein
MPLRKRYLENLHYLLTSPTDSQYQTQRLATGISRPSIFSGLVSSSTLGLPSSASSDIMHLAMLNILDLLISLWCGTIDCTKPDNRSTWTWAVLSQCEVWQEHGSTIVGALHYLSSLFD